MLDQYKVEIDEKARQNINNEGLYLEFVSSQFDGFMRFINFTNELINTLKRKAKISQFIEFRARIKDTESALKNYSSNKTLDDIFGVEIICATENEIDIIKKEMESTLSSTKSKVHNKSNGYKALHESYFMKNDNYDKWSLAKDNVPVVECQFKTIEVELNPLASHHDYKQVNQNQVQQLLENTTLKIGKQLPRMWVSNGDDIKELGYDEIIQRIYPFVDITTIKIPERNSKGRN